MMKFDRSYCRCASRVVVPLLLLLLLSPTPDAGLTRDVKAGAQTMSREQTAGRAIAATQNVVVVFDLDAARLDTIRVHGSERDEVKIENSVAGVELRRADAVKSAAATRIVITANELIASLEPEGIRAADNAARIADVSVPRGASIQIHTRSASVAVTNVAEVNVQIVRGDATIERASRGIEVISVSGKIKVTDSSGSVRLQSVSGDVEATGVRAEAGDSFQAKSVSGDVKLEGIKHTRVEAETVSGEISFDGALAREARLDAKTTSGDILLTLPADASFQISASVSLGGFGSEFPIELTSSSTRPGSLQIVGTRGSGDAKLELASHSGTVSLRSRK